MVFIEKNNDSFQKKLLSKRDIYCLLVLFTFSLILRLIFFSGFILCDDAEEFPLIQGLIANGPTFTGHLEYRIFLWAFNFLSQKVFGTYEWTFFLPTWILSSSLSCIGYLLMRAENYARREAILTGLLVSTAPFEIVIGSLRANDLFLEWFLGLALLSFCCLKQRAILQSLFMSLALWGAFYAKLWAIYAFVPLGLYYIWDIWKSRKYLRVASMCLFSGAFHGATCLYWKFKIDTYTPFINKISATYPVPTEALKDLFLTYPKLVFYGSVDFGTTLFGYVPFIVLGLLVLKLIPSKLKIITQFKFDSFDTLLLVSYGSFFLLLNFFPNNFKFDQYYSAPRIFRYLAPISFPLSLHLGKLVVDFIRAVFGEKEKQSKRSVLSFSINNKASTVACIFAVFCLYSNLQQAILATRPGREYRRDLLSVVNEARRYCPPKIIVESWTNSFLPIYLQDYCPGTEISSVFEVIDGENSENSRYVFAPSDTLEWVATKQNSWPDGTWIITGLSSCVHYGCHDGCGFQVDEFPGILEDSGWKLQLEMPGSQYPLTKMERVRVWELQHDADSGLKRASMTSVQSNKSYNEGNITLAKPETTTGELSVIIEDTLQQFSLSAIHFLL